ncbi:MAG: carbohydrate ABC transporter permease [Treponema sp.]|nr:carbohydrate ABC transporter permease [Treponema sp.]
MTSQEIHTGSRLNRCPVYEYVFIIAVCALSIFPFYFMIVSATNKSTDVIAGKMVPGLYLFQNIRTLITRGGLGSALWNSLRTTTIQTLLSIFVCSLAGYGFQVYRDRHKDLLMKILLLSMMIPFASIMVPLFKMFSRAHLLNTTLGFVLPSVSTAFLIFFFRQNSQSFPVETIQAARIDGLNEFQIYLRVYFPIMSPTFAAAAIVTCLNGWNNYMWPLLVMQSQNMRTMPLYVTGLTAGYVTDYGLLMLSVTIMTLPTVILFFTQQKRFVEGVTGSVK